MKLEDADLKDLIPPTREIAFAREADGRLKVAYPAALLEDGLEYDRDTPELPQNIRMIECRVRFIETELAFEVGGVPLNAELAPTDAPPPTFSDATPFYYTAPTGTVLVRLPITEQMVEELPDIEALLRRRVLDTAEQEYIVHHRLAHRLEELLEKAGVLITPRKRQYLESHKQRETVKTAMQEEG
jgi:hypothetical protein